MARAKKHVNMAEAKAHFSELVQRASLGEEVIIAKDNRPLVKLVAIRQPGQKRRPGSEKVWIADDFDATPDVFEDYIP
jgi:prevent-host-death family protein